jgi:hypothetical protein
MYDLSRSKITPIFTRIISAILFSSALIAANPDVILYNGKIVTVDPRFSIVQAVAVSGEHVLAVGADEAIVTMRAANTKMNRSARPDGVAWAHR